MNETKITDKNPLYTKMAPKWERCRDFIAGADALRDHDLEYQGNEDSYLELLSDKQSYTEYRSYIRRALYTNFPNKTKEIFLGMVFSKEPVIETSTMMEEYLDDIDLKGTPLVEFVETSLDETLAVGRMGILIDVPSSGEVRTLLDAKAENIRPYFSMYKAESIIEWETARINNRYQIVRIVLMESKQIYRELILDETGYHVIMWVAEKEGDEPVAQGPVYPQMRGSTIDRIPFFFIGPKESTIDPELPPLLDIVEVSRSHYQSSADLEHARFACALPTPYFIGFSEDEVDGLSLGGLNGIVARDTQAKVGYLEFAGSGVSSLENALAQKQQMIAELGVEKLSGGNGAETATAVQTRINLQTASLSDMARSISRTISKAMQMMASWAGTEEPFSVALNSDFVDNTINPQEISALMASVINGSLPLQDYIMRLKKIGVIDSTRAVDDVMKELAGFNEQDTGNAP